MIYDFVYHGSNTAGIKVLEPKVSTHGESYVYATTDIAIATLFLARWNDYIFRLNHHNGKLFIVENYKGALEQVFAGKEGYLYTLSGKSFYQPNGFWIGEVVSEVPVTVLKCEKITNIIDKLYNYQKNNQLDIYEYPRRPSCYPSDDSDLLDLLELNIINFGEGHIEKILSYHPHLMQRIKDRFNVNCK